MEVASKRPSTSITISCPGKVLVAGGYLVLDQPNVALTLATDSRFFTSITDCSNELLANGSNKLMREEQGFIIEVNSPQFREKYCYLYHSKLQKIASIGDNENSFVERCTQLGLQFIEAFDSARFHDHLQRLVEAQRGISLTLRAHNDFYSQTMRLLSAGLPLLRSSLQDLEPYASCPVDEQGRVVVSKTGLGSSAAMVTSLLASLLLFFDVIAPSNDFVSEEAAGLDADSLRIVHNLAQVVHCNAQGKVGSGFDVSSAVYGSQTYIRFDENSAAINACLGNEVEGDRLRAAVLDEEGKIWQQKMKPYELPRGFELVLGDVCGGSSSTSMAKAVLTYRRNNPEGAQLVWAALARVNEAIVNVFDTLTTMSEEKHLEYDSSMDYIANHTIEQCKVFIAGDDVDKSCIGHILGDEAEVEVIGWVVRLRELFSEMRTLLKTLGQKSGVEIVPDQQTFLLDVSLHLEGVVAGSVPGAGGNDALFVLLVGQSARQSLEELWSTWHESGGKEKAKVCALLLKGERKGRGLQAFYS